MVPTSIVFYRSFPKLLHLHRFLELIAKRISSLVPEVDQNAEDTSQVWGGSSETSDGKNHNLLNQGSSALAQWVANDIYGSLALRLTFLVKGNVGHLLAGVKQRVFRTLTQNVLSGSDKNSEHQGRGAQGSCDRRKERGENRQGKENESSNANGGGRNESGSAPAKLLENGAAQQHHDKSYGTSGRREVAHEGRVRIRIGVSLLQLSLPGNLDNVDAHSVRDDKGSKVTNVRRIHQELGRLPHSHLHLLLLCLVLALLLINTVGIGQHIILHVRKDTGHEGTTSNDGRHQILERNSPRVDTRGQIGSHLGHPLDVLSTENERNVGSHTKERIILLRLINCGHLICEAPEQQRCDNTSPHLGHDVKDGITPITDNGKRSGEATGKMAGDGINKGMRVQPAGVGEDGPRKQAEEDEEGDGAGVEHILLLELVAELGVDGGKPDGRGKVHVGLDEGDDLGTGFRGSDHQHILGIAKDGVVEKDAEKHESQGQKLLALVGWRDDILEL